MRAYWSIFLIELKKQITYTGDTLAFAILSPLTRLVAGYCLWRAAFESAGNPPLLLGKSFPQLIQYYVITSYTFLALVPTPGKISEEIYDGSLSKYLLYPRSYGLLKYGLYLGSLATVAIELTVGMIAGALFFGPSIFAGITLSSVVTFLGILILVHLVSVLLVGVIELFAFYTGESFSLWLVYWHLFQTFGGVWAPIDAMPGWFKTVATWLPFSSIGWLPSQVLINAPIDWMFELSKIFAWLLVLGVAVVTLWRKGLRTYSGVGI